MSYFLTRKKVNNFDQKPWFDNECKNARKYYHRCRKKENIVKTIGNKTDMSTASKQYKKVIKQNLLKYKRRCNSKNVCVETQICILYKT